MMWPPNHTHPSSVQDSYSSGHSSAQHYQHVMAAVTTSFAALSFEVVGVAQRWRARGLREEVAILQRLQAAEKEQLEQVHTHTEHTHTHTHSWQFIGHVSLPAGRLLSGSWPCK